MNRRLRLLRMGLATLLSHRPQGYFIPYRYAASLPKRQRNGAYPAIESQFMARRDAFATVFREIDLFVDDLLNIGELPPPAPRWQQDWFPRLDAAAAYTMVRTHQPARIIEVGSGHSTRFLARAVLDGNLDTAISAIDPAPRADIASLNVTLHRHTLQQADTIIFDALAPGDMLMIDSSHILMPGSDVDLLLANILPRLPAGVLVHIHDVFLPDDYPADWDWRGYNEQQGVAALLTGGGWEVIFASHFAVTRMADDMQRSVIGSLPLPPGARETGLWLRKLV